MKLNKDLFKKIVKAMFAGWTFDYDIATFEDDYFDLKINEHVISISVENEQQRLFNVYVYTKSENNTFVGVYDIINDCFKREPNFFETFFAEFL